MQQLNFNNRCPYCFSELIIIWVHGHGQCQHCKINIDECCKGENCSTSNSNQIINESTSDKIKGR